MVNIINLIRTGSVWGSGDAAWWWVVFDGLEYGPVSTEAMARLCGEGIVREDTPVRSTRFRRRVKAADVPALLPQINPITADAKVVQAALRGIPSKQARARWCQLYPLEPAASAVAVVVLFAVAAFVPFLRHAGASPDAAGAARVRTVACAFLLPLLAGWLCAAVASRATREKRWPTLGAFWLAAAAALYATTYAPPPERFGAAAAASAAVPADLPARADVSSAPRISPSSAPAAAPSESDDVRLNRVVRWAVLESTETYLRYDETIRALDLAGVWQPARLADPSGYPDARRRCDDVRGALRTLGEQLEQVHAGVAERARASGASSRAAERFLADYAIHREGARAAYRAFAAGETKLLSEIESLLAFLAKRSGTGAMTVRGGRLMFRDRADAEAFNGHARRLTAAAAERGAADRAQVLKGSGGAPPAADAR